MDQKENGREWTRDIVEVRLVEAFRALPNQPVFSSRQRIRPALGERCENIEALNWPARFVDKEDAVVLLTWARCRATGASVRDRYRQMGWKRTSSERARRRAVERIVAGLTSSIRA